MELHRQKKEQKKISSADQKNVHVAILKIPNKSAVLGQLYAKQVTNAMIVWNLLITLNVIKESKKESKKRVN